jgi:hypothetical protein
VVEFIQEFHKIGFAVFFSLMCVCSHGSFFVPFSYSYAAKVIKNFYMKGENPLLWPSVQHFDMSTVLHLLSDQFHLCVMSN